MNTKLLHPLSDRLKASMLVEIKRIATHTSKYVHFIFGSD
jgi:hypothetical protein